MSAETIQALEQSLQTAKESGNKVAIYEVSMSAAKLYVNNKDYTKGLEHLRIMLELADEDNNTNRQKWILGRMGKLLTATGQEAEAISMLSRLRSIHNSTGSSRADRRGDLEQLFGLLNRTGRKDSEYEEVGQDLVGDLEEGGALEKACLVAEQVAVYVHDTSPERAPPLFQRAVDLAQQAQSDREEARLLHNLSILYSRNSEWEKVVRAKKRQLELLKTLQQSAGESGGVEGQQAECLRVLATSHASLHQTEEGVACMNQAVRLWGHLEEAEKQQKGLEWVAMQLHSSGSSLQAAQAMQQRLDQGSGRMPGQQMLWLADLWNKAAQEARQAAGTDPAAAAAAATRDRERAECAQKALEMYRRAAAVLGEEGRRAQQGAALQRAGNLLSQGAAQGAPDPAQHLPAADLHEAAARVFASLEPSTDEHLISALECYHNAACALSSEASRSAQPRGAVGGRPLHLEVRRCLAAALELAERAKGRRLSQAVWAGEQRRPALTVLVSLLQHMGAQYVEAQDYSAARPFLEEACHCALALEEPPVTIQVLQSMLHTLLALEDTDGQLPWLERLIAVLQREGRTAEELKAREMQAHALLAAGQYPAAERVVDGLSRAVLAQVSERLGAAPEGPEELEQAFDRLALPEEKQSMERIRELKLHIMQKQGKHQEYRAMISKIELHGRGHGGGDVDWGSVFKAKMQIGYDCQKSEEYGEALRNFELAREAAAAVVARGGPRDLPALQNLVDAWFNTASVFHSLENLASSVEAFGECADGVRAVVQLWAEQRAAVEATLHVVHGLEEKEKMPSTASILEVGKKLRILEDAQLEKAVTEGMLRAKKSNDHRQFFYAVQAAKARLEQELEEMSGTEEEYQRRLVPMYHEHAKVLSATGQYKEARKCCTTALMHASGQGAEVSILGTLGKIYQKIGDRQQALSYFDQMLRKAEDQDLVSELVEAHTGIGSIFQSDHALDQARVHLATAYELSKGALNDIDQARCAGNLANLDILKGDLLRARDEHEQARQIYAKNPHLKVNTCIAHQNLGVVAWKLKDIMEAVHHLTAALDLAEAAGDLHAGGQAALYLADLHVDSIRGLTLKIREDSKLREARHPDPSALLSAEELREIYAELEADQDEAQYYLDRVESIPNLMEQEQMMANTLLRIKANFFLLLYLVERDKRKRQQGARRRWRWWGWERLQEAQASPAEAMHRQQSKQIQEEQLRLCARHNMFAQLVEVIEKASADSDENVIEIDINAGDAEQMTALHLAAKHGHVEVVQFLDFHDAMMNVETAEYETALELALVHGHLKVFNYLKNFVGVMPLLKPRAFAAIRQQRMHRSDDFRWSDYHEHAWNGITTEDLSDHQDKDFFGRTTLHIACYRAQLEWVRARLQAAGAEGQHEDDKGQLVEDNEGLVALHWLCSARCPSHAALARKDFEARLVSILHLLTQPEPMRLQTINKTNRNGETPLELAVRNNHRELSDQLRRLGAKQMGPLYWWPRYLAFTLLIVPYMLTLPVFVLSAYFRGRRFARILGRIPHVVRVMMGTKPDKLDRPNFDMLLTTMKDQFSFQPDQALPAAQGGAGKSGKGSLKSKHKLKWNKSVTAKKRKMMKIVADSAGQGDSAADQRRNQIAEASIFAVCGLVLAGMWTFPAWFCFVKMPSLAGDPAQKTWAFFGQGVYFALIWLFMLASVLKSFQELELGAVRHPKNRLRFPNPFKWVRSKQGVEAAEGGKYQRMPSMMPNARAMSTGGGGDKEDPRLARQATSSVASSVPEESRGGRLKLDIPSLKLTGGTCLRLTMFLYDFTVFSYFAMPAPGVLNSSPQCIPAHLKGQPPLPPVFPPPLPPPRPLPPLTPRPPVIPPPPPVERLRPPPPPGQPPPPPPEFPFPPPPVPAPSGPPPAPGAPPPPVVYCEEDSLVRRMRRITEGTVFEFRSTYYLKFLVAFLLFATWAVASSYVGLSMLVLHFPTLYKKFPFVQANFYARIPGLSFGFPLLFAVFLPVSTIFFKALDCSYTEDEDGVVRTSLDADPAIECWRGSHRFYAMLSMLCQVYFIPSSTVYGSYFLEPEGDKCDIRMTARYMILENLAKWTLSALHTMFTVSPILVPQAGCTLLFSVLSYVNLHYAPCKNIWFINHYKGYSYALVAWLALAYSYGILQVKYLGFLERSRYTQLRWAAEVGGMPTWKLGILLGTTVLVSVAVISHAVRAAKKQVKARNERRQARGLRKYKTDKALLSRLATSGKSDMRMLPSFHERSFSTASERGGDGDSSEPCSPNSVPMQDFASRGQPDNHLMTSNPMFASPDPSPRAPTSPSKILVTQDSGSSLPVSVFQNPLIEANGEMAGGTGVEKRRVQSWAMSDAARPTQPDSQSQENSNGEGSAAGCSASSIDTWRHGTGSSAQGSAGEGAEGAAGREQGPPQGPRSSRASSADSARSRAPSLGERSSVTLPDDVMGNTTSYHVADVRKTSTA